MCVKTFSCSAPLHHNIMSFVILLLDNHILISRTDSLLDDPGKFRQPEMPVREPFVFYYISNSHSLSLRPKIMLILIPSRDVLKDVSKISLTSRIRLSESRLRKAPFIPWTDDTQLPIHDPQRGSHTQRIRLMFRGNTFCAHNQLAIHTFTEL